MHRRGCRDDPRVDLARHHRARDHRGPDVETPSALGDARFRDLGSVRQHEIQAVLCAPVGPAAARRRVPAGLAARRRVQFAQPRAPSSCSRASSRRSRTGSRPAATTRRRFDYTRRGTQALPLRRRSSAVESAGARSCRPRRSRRWTWTVLITGPSGSGKSMLARVIDSNSPARAVRSSSSTARRFPRRCSRASCSAPSAARTRRRGASGARQGRGRAKAARCSSTRSASCRRRAGQAAPAARDARVPPARRDDADQRRRPRHQSRRTRTSRSASRSASSARTSTTACTSCRSRCPVSTQRREDIPDLVEHFVAEACKRHKLPRCGRPAARCSPARGHVAGPHAPARARDRGRGDPRASGETRALARRAPHLPQGAARRRTSADAREATSAFQRRHIAQALERNDWNITRTAAELDLSRQHLHNLIASFGLRRPSDT